MTWPMAIVMVACLLFPIGWRWARHGNPWLHLTRIRKGAGDETIVVHRLERMDVNAELAEVNHSTTVQRTTVPTGPFQQDLERMMRSAAATRPPPPSGLAALLGGLPGPRL